MKISKELYALAEYEQEIKKCGLQVGKYVYYYNTDEQSICNKDNFFIDVYKSGYYELISDINMYEEAVKLGNEYASDKITIVDNDVDMLDNMISMLGYR